MSQYYLPCDCGAKTPVNRSQAGMSITCSGCQKSLEVPTIRGLQSLEPVQATHARNVANAPAKPGILLRVFAGIFFLAAVASLGYGGVLAYQVYTYPLDMSGSKEEFLADTEVSLKALSPAEIWDVWNTIAFAGLEAARTPEYFQYKYAYDDAIQTMYRYLGIGVAALLAFVICLAMTPRKRNS